ncbi:hypothetical protein SDC9_143707 [bioreactor metagenome]|uniref:Uncharacterized protein n=1 Tax=bioreactor metagenome TaxID=1076179 RepID=A0A645E6W2_9ZZZZ
MADRQPGIFRLRFGPPHPAVDTGEEVVDIDPHICIEFTLEENPYIENGHQYAYRP